MKNMNSLALALLLFALNAVLGCGSSAESNGNAYNSSANTNAATAAPKKADPANCPTYSVGVKDFKENGKNFEGCRVGIEGKLWEVRNDMVTLIDKTDRTDYTGSIYIGGNFSDGRYTDIQLRISKMKIDQQYDRLPVVTFTGNVETNSGYTSIKNAVLTNSSGY